METAIANHEFEKARSIPRRSAKRKKIFVVRSAQAGRRSMASSPAKHRGSRVALDRHRVTSIKEDEQQSSCASSRTSQARLSQDKAITVSLATAAAERASSRRCVPWLFLFLGQPAVGKPKWLAASRNFCSARKSLAFDMSSSWRNTPSRSSSARPRVCRLRRRRQLTERVRRTPYSSSCW